MKWGICKWCQKFFSVDTPVNFRNHLTKMHKEALPTILNESSKQLMRNILHLDENNEPIDKEDKPPKPEPLSPRIQQCSPTTMNKFKTQVTELLLSLGCAENAVKNIQLSNLITVKKIYIFIKNSPIFWKIYNYLQ